MELGRSSPLKEGSGPGPQTPQRTHSIHRPSGGLRRQASEQILACSGADCLTGLSTLLVQGVSGSRQPSSHHCSFEGRRDASMPVVDGKVSDKRKKTEDSGQWQPDRRASPWAPSGPGRLGTWDRTGGSSGDDVWKPRAMNVP